MGDTSEKMRLRNNKDAKKDNEPKKKSSKDKNTITKPKKAKKLPPPEDPYDDDFAVDTDEMDIEMEDDDEEELDLTQIMFEEAMGGDMKDLSKKEKDKLFATFKEMNKKATDLPTMKQVLELKIDDSLKQQLFVKLMKIEQEFPYTKDYERMRTELWSDFHNFQHEDQEIVKLQMELETKNEEGFKERILKSNHSRSVKASLYERYQYLMTLAPSDSEHAKLSNLLETALAIPTEIVRSSFDTDPPQDILKRLQSYFDSKLYGQEGPKEELLSIVASKLRNPTSTRNSIALLGPPGVGKTELAQLLATGLDLPFFKISLGGVKDPAFIDGSDYVYVGSGPGLFIKGLKEMKSKRGVFFLDEIDKMGKPDDGSASPDSSLHHILDFTQNKDFHDKYIPDIGVDLSQCIFIFSLNDETAISGSFRDRIPMVTVEGYTGPEKIVIMNKYLLPTACKNCGLGSTDVTVSEEAIIQLNEQLYNNSKSGVRQLQERMDRLVRHLIYYQMIGKHIKGYGEVSFPYHIADLKHLKAIFQVNVSSDNGAWRSLYL
jgi:ATP-dependent Lon protease